MSSIREPAAEPIPGYRLVEFLGQGSFGEVWKCEAPGGVFKAIKFVHGNLQSLDVERFQAEQEWKALQLVKTIRHPFLLGLDRLEIVEGELVVVMELADSSLAERCHECREAGLPGIPRPELLAYLREAAEALDVINLQHHLQHLDVKPANLFLVNHHVKVGDFGLLNGLGDGTGPLPGGLTPLYCAPEADAGKVSARSDQYSLAVVYQELLTGHLPFTGRNARELMLRRATADPDLASLPAADRAIVARALARDPEERFPTCTEFVRALAPALMPANLSPFLGALLSGGAGARTGARGGHGGTRAGSTHDTLLLSRTNAPEAPPPAADLPAFAGYRLIKCLAQGPLGETWQAEAPGGGTRWLKFPAGLTDGLGAAEVEAIRVLTGRGHPRLLPMEVLKNDEGRLGLVCDPRDGTLADRFRQCRKDGPSGIPRRELLDGLRQVAELLDALSRDRGLHHLCLNPHALVLDGKDVLVADMGLSQLLWLSAGLRPGRLSGRYAAPELCAGEIGPACDQYSLAVIYQEMLTGTLPFVGGRSRGNTQPQLDLLPVADRGPITRALRADPGRRFATCSELIAELDRQRSGLHSRPVCLVLPPVIPIPGPAPAPADSLPEPQAVVSQMIAQAAGGFEVCEGAGFRYLLDPGKLLKHSCAARLPAGLAHLKVEAFRQQWNADLVRREGGVFVLDLPAPRTFWHRCFGRQPALRVSLKLTPPRAKNEMLTGVGVEVCPMGCWPQEAVAALAQVGPEIVGSLRATFHAEPERQLQERLPFEHALGVFPVSAEGPLDEALVCQGKDLSPGGMGLFIPKEPQTDRLYVQSLVIPELATVALLGQIVRVQRRADNLWELGLTFAQAPESYVRLPDDAHAV
jgi:serine/threonine protein kinase